VPPISSFAVVNRKGSPLSESAVCSIDHLQSRITSFDA
jgi:hypothetical protein